LLDCWSPYFGGFFAFGQQPQIAAWNLARLAESLLPILHAHEITRLMDFVVASAVVGSSKPHREIFLYALGRANMRAEDTVYVGDSYLADVLGSRGAGLHPILIDRAGNAPPIDAPVVRSLTEVLGVVDEINAGG